jgi:hypothetical protein
LVAAALVGATGYFGGEMGHGVPNQNIGHAHAEASVPMDSVCVAPTNIAFPAIVPNLGPKTPPAPKNPHRDSGHNHQGHEHP